jgi:hypothetical protein
LNCSGVEGILEKAAIVLSHHISKEVFFKKAFTPGEEKTD